MSDLADITFVDGANPDIVENLALQSAVPH
jgi:hypothetical protein